MQINKVAFIGKGGVGLLYGSMIAKALGNEAVGPEVNVAVQRIAVLIESEVSGPYAARERVVEIVVVVFAGRKSDGGQKHACGE